MKRALEHLANRDQSPRAVSVAAEWGRTFLIQGLIGIVLAALWMTLGLQ